MSEDHRQARQGQFKIALVTLEPVWKSLQLADEFGRAHGMDGQEIAHLKEARRHLRDAEGYIEWLAGKEGE
jgi:hypothetical protein